MELRPAYPVRTERMLLRPLGPGDIDELLVYRGRPDVCRYLPFEPMTRAVLEGRFESGGGAGLGRAELTEPGQAITLGARSVQGGSTGSGNLLGDVILFFTSAEHRGGEIGWVFDPAVAGQGYATEAASAVLDLAFGQFGLHRVVARLDARNEASARLCRRVGMRQEAHFVADEWFKGEWADLLVFAILEDEWRPRS